MSPFKPRFLQKLNTLFVLTVALPKALAVVYFGFIASDVYTSESSFVVRSPEKPSASTLSNKAADYQRLALEADLASKQLASAMASLESARNEAQRQQVYLERIAQPSLPDVAQEPRRMRSILSTFLLGLMAWGILSMLVAGVREHQD